MVIGAIVNILLAVRLQRGSKVYIYGTGSAVQGFGPDFFIRTWGAGGKLITPYGCGSGDQSEVYRHLDLLGKGMQVLDILFQLALIRLIHPADQGIFFSEADVVVFLFSAENFTQSLDGYPGIPEYDLIRSIAFYFGHKSAGGEFVGRQFRQGPQISVFHFRITLIGNQNAGHRDTAEK